MNRKNGEVLKNVYLAQKEKPLPGDFVKLVENDFKLIDEPFDENVILSMIKSKAKKFIKSKIKQAAFKYLQAEKAKKSKDSKIPHIHLFLQF